MPGRFVGSAWLHCRHVRGLLHFGNETGRRLVESEKEIERVAYAAAQVFAKQIVRTVNGGETQHANKHAQDHQQCTPFPPGDIRNGFAGGNTDLTHSSSPLLLDWSKVRSQEPEHLCF